MSSDAPQEERDDTDRFDTTGSERRRAAVVLGVIAVVALALVAIMLHTLGKSGDHAAPSTTSVRTGPAVIATGGSSRPARSSTSKPAPARSSTPSVLARRGRISCPTSAPCSLGSDVGHAVRALNDYRTSHGRKSVSGAVSRSARICAVTNGNDCPSDYFWEPVGRSGSQVIQKIAASGGKGIGWLLDRSTIAVEVGWAYLPRSHSFNCAVIAKH
jgi:hypothetical protein